MYREKSVSLILCILLLVSCTKKKGAFDDVKFISNYDGDTITVTIPGLPSVFGERLRVRLKGIDTPEINGKCQKEKEMALTARDVVTEILSHASQIRLRDVSRGKYFRLVAVVEADGLNVNQYLLDLGLARPFKKHRNKWCP